MTDDDSAGTTRDQAEAAPECEHAWAWVSPAGTSNSARLCMFCHQPDPDWLNGLLRGGGDTDDEATYRAALQPAFDYMIAKTYTMAYGPAGAAQAVGVLVRDIEIAEAGRDRAVADAATQRARIEDLHRPDLSVPPICVECVDPEVPFPCPTIRALDGDD